jgi:hypothetical protein
MEYYLQCRRKWLAAKVRLLKGEVLIFTEMSLTTEIWAKERVEVDNRA